MNGGAATLGTHVVLITLAALCATSFWFLIPNSWLERKLQSWNGLHHLGTPSRLLALTQATLTAILIVIVAQEGSSSPILKLTSAVLIFVGITSTAATYWRLFGASFVRFLGKIARYPRRLLRRSD